MLAQSKPQGYWRRATYEDWNASLAARSFALRSDGSDLLYVPASPDELCRISLTSAENVEPEEAVAAFVRALRRALPSGISIERFSRDALPLWSSSKSNPPPFFGLLWFTCLLASGYPDDDGTIQTRFKRLVGKMPDFKGTDGRLLDALWDETAEWSARRADRRTLVLPQADEHRTIVGRSFLLAFPNRFDRRKLERLLNDLNVLGTDPPPYPVLRALRDARTEFSPTFREHLENFEHRIASTDLAATAFWRAVRAVCRDSASTDSELNTTNDITLIGEWDEDGFFEISFVQRNFTDEEDKESDDIPENMQFEQTARDQEAIAQLLKGTRSDLSVRLRNMVRQGVLPFRERPGSEYELADGSTVGEADVALVADRIASAFVDSFGGEALDAGYPGWKVIDECAIRQSDESLPGLEGVRLLGRGSDAPRPRPIGGVRVGKEYLGARLSRPEIACPGASELLWREAKNDADDARPCRRVDEHVWAVPDEALSDLPVEIVFTATFQTSFDDRKIERSSHHTLRFVATAAGWDYKLANAGDYRREVATTAVEDVTGGVPVPLISARPDVAHPEDLIAIDSEAVALGSVVGELLPVGASESIWISAGSSRCRQLIYVGDLDQPVQPTDDESSDKGAVRRWKKAFDASDVSEVFTRVGGRLVPVSNDERLREIFDRYRARARHAWNGGTRRELPSRTLPAQRSRQVDDGISKSELTETLSSICCNRGRVRLKDVFELFIGVSRGRSGLFAQRIIRAWQEAGLIDVLHLRTRRGAFVVARRPRFVMTKRGAHVEGRLIGLAPRRLREDLIGAVERSSLELSWLSSTTHYQPSTAVLNVSDRAEIVALSESLGLTAPKWLGWRAGEALPDDVRVPSFDDVVSDAPQSDAFEVDGRWDWSKGHFIRYGELSDSSATRVERHRSRHHNAIHVVLQGDEERYRTWSREWALLRARELQGKPAFLQGPDGQLSFSGRSALNLPAPWGRLCTLLGTRLPGPLVSDIGEIEGYVYPFGVSTLRYLAPGLPDRWIGPAESNGDV